MTKNKVVLPLSAIVFTIGILWMMRIKQLDRPEGKGSHLSEILLEKTRSFVKSYRQEMGRWPTSFEDLEGWSHRDESRMEILEAIKLDPWGNPTELELQKNILRVRMSGADGPRGTEDDLAFDVN